MSNLRRRGFFSSVSSVALLSIFFVSGVPSIKNASAAFAPADAFEEGVLKQSHRLAGLSYGADKENIFANAQQTTAHRRKTEEKKKVQEDLDETLKGTQERLAEEIRKLGAKDQRIVELTEQVCTLEEQIRFAQENRQTAEDDIRDLRKQIEIAQSNLRVIQQNNQAHKETDDADKKKIQELTRALHEVESKAQGQADKMKDLYKDLERVKSEQRVASKEQAYLKVRREALEKELAETNHKLTMAREQIDTLTIDLEGLQKKEKDVARTLFTFVGDLDLGEDMISGVSMDTLLEGVNLDLLLGSVTEELNTRSAAAESRRLALEAEIARLKQKSEKDKAEMEGKERTFEDALHTKEERIKELSLSLSDLEEKMSAVEAQRLELNEQLHEREEQLRQEKGQNVRLEAEVQRLGQALKEAELHSKDLQQRMDVLRAEKEAVEAAKTKLSELLELAKGAAAQDKETLTMEIAGLQQRILELQQRGMEERQALELQHRNTVEVLSRTHKERLDVAEAGIADKVRAHQQAVEQLDQVTRGAFEAKNAYEARLEAAQHTLQKAQEEAQQRLDAQRAQFADDVAGLGREHGLETQRLKADHARLVAEKEEEVRRIEEQIEQLTQTMTADQASKAETIMSLEQSVKLARQVAEEEQRRYADEVQQLTARQKEAVQALEQRLEQAATELASTRALLEEAQTHAVESTTTFESKIEDLRASLEQEQQKNKEEVQRLQEAHATLLEARDKHHQEASALLEGQLQEQVSKIKQKEDQLESNRKTLEQNAAAIGNLERLLGRKTRGLKRLKDVKDSVVEAGAEALEQVDQLNANLGEAAQRLEALERQNKQLTETQEFLNAEILTLKKAETELLAKSTQEKEMYAKEKEALGLQLEASLTSNKLLQAQLAEAHAILKEIKRDQSRLDISAFDREDEGREGSPLSEELGLVSVVASAPQHHPVATATRRMVDLVRVLKDSERGLQSRLVEAETIVSDLRREQEAQAHLVEKMAATHEAQSLEMAEAVAVVQHQEEQIKQLRRDVREREESLDILERDRLVLNTELVSQESRIHVLEEKVQMLEEEKKALEVGIGQLSEELEEEQRKAHQFRAAVQDLNATLDNSRQTIGELEEQQEESFLEVLRQKQEAIRGQKEEYLEDLAGLHTRLAELRGQLEAAQEEITHTREFADLQVEEAYRMAEGRIRDFEEKIAAVLAEIRAQEAVVREKENEVYKYEVQLRAAQAEIQEQKEALEQLRITYDQLQTEYDQSEARVGLLTEELERKRKENDSVTQLLSMAQAQRKRAETDAAKEQGTRDGLLRELAATRKSLAEAAKRQAALVEMEGSVAASVQPVVPKITVETGTGPMTPVKAPRADANAFKTPEALRTTVRVSRTPGTGLKAVMSPRLQGLGAALTEQFGVLGAHNQQAAFGVVMEYLRKAGVVQFDPENSMDYVHARTPLRSGAGKRTPGLRDLNRDDNASPSKLRKSTVGGNGQEVRTSGSFRQKLFEDSNS